MTRYFIGLRAPAELAAVITEARRRFGAAGEAAIRRCEPHLTLVSPFTTELYLITNFQITLRECNLKPFILTMAGIGRFGRGVWFVGVEASEPLNQLQTVLWELVHTDERFTPVRTDYAFRPHLTIVSRLSEAEFETGRSILDEINFPTTSWIVDAITLYRHETDHWVPTNPIPISGRIGP